MNKTFSTPVDASNYIGGFGVATGARIRSHDYETGEIRFSLIATDGTVASQVNGIVVSENADIAAEIRAEVEKTIPSKAL